MPMDLTHEPSLFRTLLNFGMFAYLVFHRGNSTTVSPAKLPGSSFHFLQLGNNSFIKSINKFGLFIIQRKST